MEAVLFCFGFLRSLSYRVVVRNRLVFVDCTDCMAQLTQHPSILLSINQQRASSHSQPSQAVYRNESFVAGQETPSKRNDLSF